MAQKDGKARSASDNLVCIWGVRGRLLPLSKLTQIVGSHA